MLAQLPEGFTALVTGAGGGIGAAVVEALLASPRPGRVIAVGRHPPAFEDARHQPLAADLTREAGRRELADLMGESRLHLLFNTIGALHDDTLGIHPEKKLDDLDPTSLAHLFQVNAVTPALLLQVLQPSLKGRHPALVASLSARVGSIEDNRLGGWYAYRASKAAHNMLMKTRRGAQAAQCEPDGDLPAPRHHRHQALPTLPGQGAPGQALLAGFRGRAAAQRAGPASARRRRRLPRLGGRADSLVAPPSAKKQR